MTLKILCTDSGHLAFGGLLHRSRTAQLHTACSACSMTACWSRCVDRSEFRRSSDQHLLGTTAGSGPQRVGGGHCTAGWAPQSKQQGHPPGAFLPFRVRYLAMETGLRKLPCIMIALPARLSNEGSPLKRMN